MISGTRKVLHTAAADHHDAVLLKIVAFARDVGCHFDSVGKTNSGDLSERGIRLLRRRCLNGCADAALLRRACLDSAVLQGVEAALKRRSLGFLHRSLSSFSD